MTRLAALVLALMFCATCIGLALLSANQLSSWYHSHWVAPWIVPALNLFTSGCIAISATRRKKHAVEEERLTPIGRNDPRTGLRLR